MHFLLALLLLTAAALGQAPAPGALPEKPLHSLTDHNISALGHAALSIRPTEWKHGETDNFVYHFFNSFIVSPVSVEAEFYYRIHARELGRDTAQWERKGHIFIFEADADWATFKTRGNLDPWTGGLHAGGELFLQRNPAQRHKDSTLGHEIAHLVVHRFFGPGVPLWLNEGYAEYAASRGYAAFHRARGYSAKPRSTSVPPSAFQPLAKLVSAVAYPSETLEVATFYAQSERLVRFLSATDKAGFGLFFEAMAKGNRFDTALHKGYGNKFASLDALEREFKVYASKDHGSIPL